VRNDSHPVSALLLQRQEKVFECAERIRITILKEFPTPDLDSCARIMSSLMGAAAVLIESCEDAKAALDCFTSSLEHQLLDEYTSRRGN
jgi:hypothetical protein